MSKPDSQSDTDEHLAPLSQKQEDLLLSLFLQLSVTDRKTVIKVCRDLMRKSDEPAK